MNLGGCVGRRKFNEEEFGMIMDRCRSDLAGCGIAGFKSNWGNLHGCC